MKLTKETKIKLNERESNILGHLCYAAYKHWNNLNYERLNYQELLFEKMPDWYEQKKAHKDDFFARLLPSQTAQEVAKQLDKAWKSYFVLKKTGGIENPQPPRFKKDKMAVVFIDNSIKKIKDNKIRLSLPIKLKEHMRSKYGIDDDYLVLSNVVFENISSIKQIKLYPPEKEEARCIIVYEIEDKEKKEDNGKYLSIDMGINNLLTCYNNTNGEVFIIGRKYFSIERKYLKAIKDVQSRWYKVQSNMGVERLKSSKHIARLYKKMNNSLNDYIHKITRSITKYCRESGINTVIVGDIKNIREEFNKGRLLNQKMHSLPFNKVIKKLEYKLAIEGISLIMQKESYSSQCSPLSEKVSKQYAEKNKRVKRGLFVDGKMEWNADSVGAYNILRLYRDRTEKIIHMEAIKPPYVMKVAV